MRNPSLLKCTLLLALATAAGAADAPSPQPFPWLSGHWCTLNGDWLSEQLWMPAEGDMALGVQRTTKAGKTTSFEYLRIETRDGVTNLIVMLDGQPGMSFRMTASGADWARFEDPRQKFPNRVEYRRTAEGLQREIAGPGPDGKEISSASNYRRCVD